MHSAERLVNGDALLGEELGSLIGHVEAIFQPNSELAVDRHGGLVAETHAASERRLVAEDEIGPLMTLETDTVTRAMGQSGHLVSGPEAGVHDDLARGDVHVFTGLANHGRGEPRILR